jgi:hypothetical protein
MSPTLVSVFDVMTPPAAGPSSATLFGVMAAATP